MKVLVEIEHAKHEVEIVADGPRLSARVGNRNYVLESSEPEPNVFLLKDKGKIFEVFVSPNTPPAAPYHIRIGTTELEATVIDPKRLRGASGGDEQSSGRAEIKTAMPGKVVRILVSEGDSVQKGDGVIVVEAMKMQNEIKSPKDGVVAEIRFEEGSTVAGGEVLAIIE
ncbi:MAG: biotin/lipoyl-containing protein [Pyrinomonadaceae bacterium]